MKISFLYIKQIVQIITILYVPHLINSSEFFSSLKLISEDILIVDEKGIFILEKDLSTEPNYIITFNETLLSSKGETQNITIVQYPTEKNGNILCKAKNKMFIISNDYSKICNTTIIISSDHTVIIPYDYKVEEGNNNYYYIICFLDKIEDKGGVFIREYYFNMDTCENNLIFSMSFNPLNSFEQKADITVSDTRIDCELMYNDILTCFTYNGYPSELSYSSIDIKNNFTYLLNYSGTSNILSTVPNKIRSVLSNDKKKAFVCFQDNTCPIYCSIFDLLKNEFNDEKEILPRSTVDKEGFKIEYFNKNKKYIVYTRFSNVLIDMIILDENFTIVSTNILYQKCFTSFTLVNCYTINNYYVFYSNEYKKYIGLTVCSNNEFKNYTMPEECNMDLDENNIEEENEEENIEKEEKMEYEDFIEKEIINIIEEENNSVEFSEEIKEKNLIENEESKEKFNENEKIISEENLEEKYNSIYENENYSEIECDGIISDGVCLEESDSNICSNEFPYLNTETNKCSNYCEFYNIIKNICKISVLDDNVLDDILSKYRDLISNNNESLYNTIINDENIKIEITNSSQQNILIQQINEKNDNYKFNNLSMIDFKECENKLKTEYGIDEFLILKVDIINTAEDGTKITDVEYELYNPITKKRLNLSICEYEPIYIYTPYYASEDEQNILNNAIDQGYDLLDSENSFYNEICTPFTSENDSDIILSDRRLEYYTKNMSEWCGEGCSYIDYNKNNKVKCECMIKIVIENVSQRKNVSLENIETSFLDIKTYANFNIIKCYKLVFSKKGLKSNIGSYFMLVFILCSIILFILFFKDGDSKIKGMIHKIINDKHSPPVKAKKKSKLFNNTSVRNLNDESYNLGLKINSNRKSSDNKQNNLSANKIIKCSKVKNPFVYQNNIVIVNSISKVNKKKRKESLLLRSKKNKTKNNKNDKKKEIDKNKNKFNDEELNIMEYKDALKYDKRTYLQYYWALLKKKQLILFTFIPNNDYNIFELKFILFLLSIGLYFTVNALIFDDATMHNIYQQKSNIILS